MRFDSLKEHTTPFRHYTFDDFFHKDELKEYKSINLHPDGGNVLTKTRTSSKLRIFVDDDVCKNHPLFQKLRQFFCSESTLDVFRSRSNAKVPEYLRIEIIKDVGESWLEPHKDIPEKFMSMLVFVNDCDEDVEIGTDLYDEHFNVIKTVPFIDNTGYFFYPGNDTWHGLERKKIKTHRKMLMVNYVSFPTEILISDYCSGRT